MHLRATDTLSRQGGDEFVLIFDSLTHEHDALVIAEKSKARLQRRVLCNNARLH